MSTGGSDDGGGGEGERRAPRNVMNIKKETKVRYLLRPLCTPRYCIPAQ